MLTLPAGVAVWSCLADLQPDARISKHIDTLPPLWERRRAMRGFLNFGSDLFKANAGFGLQPLRDKRVHLSLRHGLPQCTLRLFGRQALNSRRRCRSRRVSQVVRQARETYPTIRRSPAKTLPKSKTPRRTLWRSAFSSVGQLLQHPGEGRLMGFDRKHPLRPRDRRMVRRRRWLAENAFFRYKSIIGDGLRARSPAG